MDTSLDTRSVAGERPVEVNRSRAVYAYDELKRRLLVGEFPLTRRLGEVALGEALGVSRTPVREALSRLHAEGLVVRLGDGGFSPAAPDLPTIAELYEVRRSLEFTALNRGCHDRAMLEQIQSHWAFMSAPSSDADCGPEFVLHDEDFHLGLARAAGNHSLVELLSHTNERIRFVRMQDFLTADRVTKTIDEHLGIVSALLEDRADLAEHRLRSHLFVSERVVESRAALALSRMLSGGTRG